MGYRTTVGDNKPIVKRSLKEYESAASMKENKYTHHKFI